MGYIAKGSITLDTVNDAYTVSLTKQSCVIHADFDGTNPRLTDAWTQIQVLRGERTVAFDCATIGDNEYPVVQIINAGRTSYTIKITDIDTTSLEGYVDLRLKTDDGYATTIRFAYAVVRESSMLDWVLDWEGSKTKIGGSYIMTPKLFIGKKDKYEGYADYSDIRSIPNITGVYIGPDGDSTGIYGYDSGKEVFHIAEEGAMIGGWNIKESGLYSPGGSLRILSGGSIQAVNDQSVPIWQISEDGSASFANGNAKFYANGDAEFSGTVTSGAGKIGGWALSSTLLYNIQIAMSSEDRYIAIANIANIPFSEGAWDGNHFDWVKQYGGVRMYCSSSVAYGFEAYTAGGDNLVFSAGATNQIAGWYFDTEAIWSGEKNDTPSAYTTQGITIGSNGMRGPSWYIDTNGDISFMDGQIAFSSDGDGGNIVGWKLNDKRFSTNHVALLSEDSNTGLYMSAHQNAMFNTRASSYFWEFITTNGGAYMRVEENNTDFAAYDIQGKRLFQIQSNSTSYIAGWRFDDTVLYTGTKTTTGYTASENITLGPTGLRGYKWRLENDGSGAVAGGNIAWDKDGNVTLDEGVKIGWSNLGSTVINSEGVFAGKISADNITAGTISTADIKNSSNTWYLNQDGSGALANGNISWASNGEWTAVSGTIGGWHIDDHSIYSSDTNSITLDSTSQCITAISEQTGGIYDSDTTLGAVLTFDAGNGVIKIQAKNAPSCSNGVAYMTPNGILANLAGINPNISGSSYTHRGAIVGLGFANVDKDILQDSADSTAIAGVYGKAYNYGTAPAYGGMFYNLLASGLVLGKINITGSSNTTTQLQNQHTLVIGYTSALATVYLPKEPQEGQIVIFKQWWSGKMRITPSTGHQLYDDTSVNEYVDCTEGKTGVYMFTSAYLTENGQTVKKEAWIFSQW